MQLQAWLIVEIQGKAPERVYVCSSLFLQESCESILDMILEITMLSSFT